MFRDLRGSITAVILHLSIAIFLGAVSQAQASPSATSTAPSSSSSPADRVVLKVGDVQVTQAQFEAVIGELEAQQGPADLSRKALGDNYASLLMLSHLAVAQHLDTSPSVVRQLAIDRTQILSNAEFDALKRQAKPSPQEISDYYNAHLADYDVVQIRRTFIWSGAAGSKTGMTPQQAEALAGAVRQAYKSGGDVSKVVNSTPHNSDEAVVDKEPLTFQRGEMPERLDKAAFALKEGEWTELNDAPGAYVFIQVVKRSRRDLKDVSGQIEKTLQADKLKEELESLKKKSGIWMDETYFASKAPIPSSSAQSEASGLGNSSKERGEK